MNDTKEEHTQQQIVRFQKTEGEGWREAWGSVCGGNNLLGGLRKK